MDIIKADSTAKNRETFYNMISQNGSETEERFAIDGDLLIAVSIAIMKRSNVFLWGCMPYRRRGYLMIFDSRECLLKGVM